MHPDGTPHTGRPPGTPPRVAAPSPPPPPPAGRLRDQVERGNPLAAELRRILDDLHDAEHGDVPTVVVRERLERLAEHAERVSDRVAELVPVDATTELTASFGLEPDQEIRSRALDSAARLIAPISARAPLNVDDIRDAVARLWVDLAQCGEAWIATGGACGCTVLDDPECPLHGGEPRRRSIDR